MSQESVEGTDRDEVQARRLVLNPTSGRGDHVDQAHRLAEEYGFSVVETEREGHAVELAKRAADEGVDLLGVCGGDGTLHEVAVGLYECDALDSVTLAVVPGGTGNFVAGELGLDSMEAGFEVALEGETRVIDLGMVDDEPFVMSVIVGLPANAAAAATQDLKHQFGPLAFVMGGIREGLAFDGLHASVDAHSQDGEVEWTGEALAVLVGNVRKFTKEGGQADAEDGLLEVTIVEEMPAGEMLVEAVEQRLFQEETPHVIELHATGLDMTPIDEGELTYSVDGEIRTFESVDIGVIPEALRLKVGPGYEPSGNGATAE